MYTVGYGKWIGLNKAS